jgi:hypothetical protein
LEGNSALHCALISKDSESIRLLTERHANVNAVNKHGQTSLHLALKQELPNEATLIIQHGASVNAKDQYGTTPLHIAAKLYNPDLVKLLLDRGALVNNVIVNHMGWKESPLSNAIRQHHDRSHVSNDMLDNTFMEVVNHLVEAGANTDTYVPGNLKDRMPALVDLLAKNLSNEIRRENITRTMPSMLMNEDANDDDSQISHYITLERLIFNIRLEENGKCQHVYWSVLGFRVLTSIQL